MPVSNSYVWLRLHLKQQIIYILSFVLPHLKRVFFMRVNSVGQGCRVPSTGCEWKHTQERASGDERCAAVSPVAGVCCWQRSDWYHIWSCVLHSSPFTFSLDTVTLSFFHFFYLCHIRLWQKLSVYNWSHCLFTIWNSLDILNKQDLNTYAGGHKMQ